MEVIYTGLRQTPEQIVVGRPAGGRRRHRPVDPVRRAQSHLPARHGAAARQGLDDVLVVVGGIIPDVDIPRLKEIGVKGIFLPGTPMQDIVDVRPRARASAGRRLKRASDPPALLPYLPAWPSGCCSPTTASRFRKSSSSPSPTSTSRSWRSATAPQAIARLNAEPFDIVLADVGMPGKDGFDVAAFVRDRPRWAHVPSSCSLARSIRSTRRAWPPWAPRRCWPSRSSRRCSCRRCASCSRAAPCAASITPLALPDDAAPAADVLLNAPPAAGDAAPSVDDYFERLDRAFAGLNVPLEPRDPLKPSASRTHANGHAAARTAPPAPEPPAPPADGGNGGPDVEPSVERQSTPGERNRRGREERAGRTPSRRCSPSSRASCRRPP